jgi:hypothetical protein
VSPLSTLIFTSSSWVFLNNMLEYWLIVD